MMALAFFSDPHNAYGRWLAKPSYYRLIALVVIASAVGFPCVLDYVETQQKMTALQQETAALTQQAAQQEKIAVLLRQKADSRRLTPALAGKILPINQQIQALAPPELQPQLQWQFDQTPVLNLQLQGEFQILHRFLTALFNDIPALSLYHLQMDQINGENEGATDVGADLILQLKKDEP